MAAFHLQVAPPMYCACWFNDTPTQNRAITNCISCICAFAALTSQNVLLNKGLLVLVFQNGPC